MKTRRGPPPGELVATALAGPLDARATYNVACFYAQTGRTKEARKHLEAAVRSVSGSLHTALVAWAWKDPSLAPALRSWEDVGDRLGPAPTSHVAAAEPAELEQIDAIGGYAADLAKRGIHTPERLREAIEQGEELGVRGALLRRWLDLLDLPGHRGHRPRPAQPPRAGGHHRSSRAAADGPASAPRAVAGDKPRPPALARRAVAPEDQGVAGAGLGRRDCVVGLRLLPRNEAVDYADANDGWPGRDYA